MGRSGERGSGLRLWACGVGVRSFIIRWTFIFLCMAGVFVVNCYHNDPTMNVWTKKNTDRVLSFQVFWGCSCHTNCQVL